MKQYPRRGLVNSGPASGLSVATPQPQARPPEKCRRILSTRSSSQINAQRELLPPPEIPGCQVYMKVRSGDQDVQQPECRTRCRWTSKAPAEDVDLEQVPEASLAPMGKWICTNNFVNSKSRHVGGYPTGDAPTPRRSLVRVSFGHVVNKPENPIMTTTNTENQEKLTMQNGQSRGTYGTISKWENHKIDESPETTRNSLSRGLQKGDESIMTIADIEEQAKSTIQSGQNRGTYRGFPRRENHKIDDGFVDTKNLLSRGFQNGRGRGSRTTCG